MRKEAAVRYGNDVVTVIWTPALCVHSGICARGLPQVFDPRRKPWVAIDAAPAREIVEQVARCPSGALAIAPGRRQPPLPRQAAEEESES